eukprot:TRINITY_DN4197_c0_g1_i1.p1 TRINITY_DN4197_c0_g1~~TRINITY_DN4197_c0_g1_i1.p1  ORF type:complete len:131 (+),score=12.97 TRINITY_DN4197_c0_g1_i1:731-1123(+)
MYMASEHSRQNPCECAVRLGFFCVRFVCACFACGASAEHDSVLIWGRAVLLFLVGMSQPFCLLYAGAGAATAVCFAILSSGLASALVVRLHWLLFMKRFPSTFVLKSRPFHQVSGQSLLGLSAAVTPMTV